MNEHPQDVSHRKSHVRHKEFGEKITKQKQIIKECYDRNKQEDSMDE